MTLMTVLVTYLARLTPLSPVDVNGDGAVNFADLVQLLAEWS